MAFTIPNSSAAAFPDQAEPDKVDLDILSAGHDRTGVISGCAVTAQAIPDLTVAVASGVAAVAGTRATVAAGNVVITAADLTNPRFCLIAVDNAGTKSAVVGTAAANPVFPAIPANSVILAAVYVPALDVTIAANQIIDKRVMLRDTHLLASGTALGPDHTISGANAGEVLRALSATTAAFDAIADADLPSTITRDSEALLQSLADAKGDLAVASAADTWGKEAAGNNGDILQYDSTQTRGVKKVPYGATPSGVRIFDEMLYNTAETASANLGPGNVALSGTGAQLSIGSGEASHPGITVCEAGTTTTGRCSYLMRAHWAVGSGRIRVGAWVKTEANLSTVLERYELGVGLATGANFASATGLIEIHYRDDINSGKWEAKTLSAGTPTTLDSGTTVLLSTWYFLELEINAAGTSVEFFLNKTSFGTITTNIPTGGLAFAFAGLVKSVGTTNRTVLLDAIYVENDFTTAR